MKFETKQTEHDRFIIHQKICNNWSNKNGKKMDRTNERVSEHKHVCALNVIEDVHTKEQMKLPSSEIHQQRNQNPGKF